MNNWVRISAAAIALAALSGCGVFKGGPRTTPTLGERKPILFSATDVKVDPTIANVDVLVPLATANTAWTQPGGNAAKSMGHLALPATLAKAWSVEIPGGSSRVRLAAAPIVADGRLYVMDTDATVHAFDAGSGAPVWQVATATGKENRDVRFGGGVSFDAGRVYATNGLGDVVALNAADGSEVWRVRPAGPLRGSPTIANGNVYAVTQDNQLYALDQNDGSVTWSAPASLESQGVFGVAAPASAQGTVVAGFSSGELNAYRYENGRALWTDSLSRSSISTSVSSLSDIDAEPVIDRGRVFALGQGGRMVAIDMGTGQRAWELSIAGVATPYVAGEWLFVVTDDARLIAVQRGTGRIRWISQLRQFENEKKSRGAIIWHGPVAAGDRLVLVNTEGDIVSASIKDGTVGETISTKKAISLPPVVANNTLYILDEEGRITAYR